MKFSNVVAAILVAAPFLAQHANAMQITPTLTMPIGPTAQNTTSAAQSNANPTAVAGSNSGANQQHITFNSSTPATTTTNQNISGSETIRNVPSMAAPNLTTSNDTCMGSVGGAVGVAGFGGSFGTTHVDPNCVTWKSGIGFWNQGLRATSIARECQDDKNRKALRMTGISCIWVHGEQAPVEYGSDGLPVPYEVQMAHITDKSQPSIVAASRSNNKHGEPTDPFVRYRMGLLPLAGQENAPPYKN